VGRLKCARNRSESRYSSTSFAREENLSLDLDQAQFASTAVRSGSMSRNTLMLVAWYSWFAVLVGVLVYFFLV
jgi:hypothetical protein